MESPDFFNDRFWPLRRALRSPFNGFVTVLAVLVFFDWMSGAPVMSKVMALLYQSRGVDVYSGKTEIVTIFGGFHDITQLGRVADIYLFLIFFGYAALAYGFGLLVSLFRK